MAGNSLAEVMVVSDCRAGVDVMNSGFSEG
jgi:hypothetical protein